MTRRNPRRGRGAVALSLVVPPVLLAALTAVVPAAAVPAPEEPTAVAEADQRTTTRDDVVDARDAVELFRETFEEGDRSRPTAVEDYVGVAGQRYTADPYWQDVSQCNGIVTGAGTADEPRCSANDRIRTFAKAIGTVNDEGAAGNHALSADTLDRDPAGQRRQLSTVAPVEVAVADHFVSFGVSTAAHSCHLPAPLLAFSLLDGSTARPVADRPIDACDDPTAHSVPVDGLTLEVGRHVSAGGLLFDGDRVGILLENERDASWGNDFAVDDITVLDSTPTLAWSFAEGDHVVGDPVAATVTVVNTTEEGRKQGWSFRTALPEGTRPADGAVPLATCDVDRVALEDGELVVEGGALDAGDATCDVTVDVVGEAPGTHVVDASALRSARGVLDPATATLVLSPERTVLDATATAHVTGGDDVADLGEEVRADLLVTNASNVPVHGLTVAGATCPVDALPVGASTTCTGDPHVVTQSDLDRGSVELDLRADAVSRAGALVSSPRARASVPTTPATTGLGLVLRHDAGDDPAVGDVVAVTAAVVNAGNVTVDDLTVLRDGAVATEFSCPVSVLAPGAGTECTTTLVLDQAAVDAGGVTVPATASGRAPSGSTVSRSATVAIVVAERPHLAVDASLTVGGDSARPVPGDPVALRVDVVADGTVTVHDVAARLGGAGGVALECGVDELAPGARTQCRLDQVLDQADVDAGRIARDVVVTGASPQGASVVEQRHVEAAVTGAPALAATATTGVPGDRPVAGNALPVTVHVENTGTVTLEDVAAATDRDGLALTCPGGGAAPGADLTCAGTLVLTQADLDAGHVDLGVEVTATAPDGAVVERPTSVRVALPTSDDLALDLSAGLADDQRAPAAGDAVDVTASVTNTGTTTLATVAVEAPGTAVPWVCDADRLAPGSAATCEVQHVLSQAEVDAGSTTISATAHATSPAGAAVTAPDSISVALPASSSLAVEAVLAPSLGDRAPVVDSSTTATAAVTNTGTTTLDSVVASAGRGDDHDAAAPSSRSEPGGPGEPGGATEAGSGSVCAVDRLAPGETTTCTTSGPQVAQDDLEVGHVAALVGVSALDPRGAVVESQARVALELPVDPGLTLEVTPRVERAGVEVDPAEPAQPGDVVDVLHTVRNTGDLVVADVTVDERLGAVRCPVTFLLPGQATECVLVVPHVVDDAEATQGSVNVAAQAFGQVAREATSERVLVPTVAEVERPVRIHSLLLERSVRAKHQAVSVLPAPLPTPRVLAFTGASLGLVFALGLTLTGAGTALRTRRRVDEREGADGL